MCVCAFVRVLVAAAVPASGLSVSVVAVLTAPAEYSGLSATMLVATSPSVLAVGCTAVMNETVTSLDAEPSVTLMSASGTLVRAATSRATSSRRVFLSASVMPAWSAASLIVMHGAEAVHVGAASVLVVGMSVGRLAGACVAGLSGRPAVASVAVGAKVFRAAVGSAVRGVRVGACVMVWSAGASGVVCASVGRRVGASVTGVFVGRRVGACVTGLALGAHVACVENRCFVLLSPQWFEKLTTFS